MTGGIPAKLQAQLTEALKDSYRIEKELGRGSMARVYLAHDLRTNRPVAVKLLPPELATATNAERFLREVAFAKDLNHPGILPLIDSGSGDGLCWYVMPVVDGITFRDRLKTQGIPAISETLRLAAQVGSALAYAHEKGIVHRDLKPENIMIANSQALLVDFGLARAVGAESNLTGLGMPLGTPTYMSPEQITGAADVDLRADIYSFACVIYEMFTGRPPFLGTTVVQLLQAHMAVTPEPPSRHRAGLGPAIDAAILKALAKDPDQRQGTVDRFIKDLGTAPEPASGPAPVAPAADSGSKGFLGRLFGKR